MTLEQFMIEYNRIARETNLQAMDSTREIYLAQMVKKYEANGLYYCDDERKGVILEKNFLVNPSSASPTLNYDVTRKWNRIIAGHYNHTKNRDNVEQLFYMLGIESPIYGQPSIFAIEGHDVRPSGDKTFFHIDNTERAIKWAKDYAQEQSCPSDPKNAIIYFCHTHPVIIDKNGGRYNYLANLPSNVDLFSNYVRTLSNDPQVHYSDMIITPSLDTNIYEYVKAKKRFARDCEGVTMYDDYSRPVRFNAFSGVHKDPCVSRGQTTPNPLKKQDDYIK